ncbi:MAG: hypothetical protein ACKO91_15400 [Acidimicrobiales bacterium]|jgi:hypothetical protein
MATAAERACPIPVPKLPLAEVTPELQELIDRGVDPRWVRTLGHAPKWFVAWTKFYWPLLFGGTVEVRTKEAARLRIAQLNGCHY